MTDTEIRGIELLRELMQGMSARGLAAAADAVGLSLSNSTVSRMLKSGEISVPQGVILGKIFNRPAIDFHGHPLPVTVLPEATIHGMMSEISDLIKPGGPSFGSAIGGEPMVIPLARIMPSPLNPRRSFNPEKLAELADSISAKGLQTPILVREADEEGIHRIVFGERRWRALCILVQSGILPERLQQGIPCVMRSMTDDEHRAIAVIENVQREDLNELEEARSFAAMQAGAPDVWTTAAIAQSIGKTVRYVQIRLQLLVGLSDDAKEAFEQERITFSQARRLVAMPIGDQVPLLRSFITRMESERHAAEMSTETPGGQRLLSDWRAAAEHAAAELAGGLAPKTPQPDDIEAAASRPFMDRHALDQLAAELVDTGQVRAVMVIRNGYEADYHFEPGGDVTLLWADANGGLCRRDAMRPKPTEEDRATKNAKAPKIYEAYEAELAAAWKSFGDALYRALTEQDAMALWAANTLLRPDWQVFPAPAYLPPGSLQRMKLLPDGKERGMLSGASGDAAALSAFEQGVCYADDRGDPADLLFTMALNCLTATLYKMSSELLPLHPIFAALAERHNIAVPPCILLTAKQRDKELAARLELPAAAPDQADMFAGDAD